jgi:hypothetical protein
MALSREPTRHPSSPGWLDEKPYPAVYLPMAQYFASQSNFIIRTSCDPLPYKRAVEEAIHSVDPMLPVYSVRPLKTAIRASYVGQRIGGSFIGVFGAVALALATMGLYGLLAYTVTQRSCDVGIRMALGATRAEVLRLILRQGLPRGAPRHVASSSKVIEAFCSRTGAYTRTRAVRLSALASARAEAPMGRLCNSFNSRGHGLGTVLRSPCRNEESGAKHDNVIRIPPPESLEQANALGGHVALRTSQ